MGGRVWAAAGDSNTLLASALPVAEFERPLRRVAEAGVAVKTTKGFLVAPVVGDDGGILGEAPRDCRGCRGAMPVCASHVTEGDGASGRAARSSGVTSAGQGWSKVRAASNWGLSSSVCSVWCGLGDDMEHAAAWARALGAGETATMPVSAVCLTTATGRGVRAMAVEGERGSQAKTAA